MTVYTKEMCVEAIKWWQETQPVDYEFDMVGWGRVNYIEENSMWGKKPFEDMTLEERFCDTAGCLSGTIALYHGDPTWYMYCIDTDIDTEFGIQLDKLFFRDGLTEKEALAEFWELVEKYN